MRSLTGRQRAAVVLAQLDGARAARLLAEFSEAETISLTTEIARLPVLDQGEIEGVVADLHRRVGALAPVRGGEDVAMGLLTARFGAERATEIMDEMRWAGRPRPFAFLNAVDPARLALFLGDEHPQLIVAVLTQLRREQAARVLDHLQTATRTEVARRVVVARGLSQQASEQLHRELEARLLSIAVARADALETDGVGTLVGILTSVDQATERQVLARLDEHAPDLAEQVRARLFTFEDLVALDARTLQEVLRQAEADTLALALKGKSPDIVERVASELTERRAEQLREDLGALPPQALRAVQEAESALVRATLALDAAGVIALERSDDPILE